MHKRIICNKTKLANFYALCYGVMLSQVCLLSLFGSYVVNVNCTELVCIINEYGTADNSLKHLTDINA